MRQGEEGKMTAGERMLKKGMSQFGGGRERSAERGERVMRQRETRAKQRSGEEEEEEEEGGMKGFKASQRGLKFTIWQIISVLSWITLQY